MAATQYVKRFIIVIRSDLAAAANIASKQQDTDPEGGERTWTAPISATGNPPAQAYICNWAMTPAQAQAIRNRLQERGATVAETTPVPFGQAPASNRFAVFDAADWTAAQVLSALNLKTIDGPR